MRASGGFNEDHVGTQISQNLPADHGTFVGQIDHAIWTEHDPFSLLCERGKRPVCRGFTEALGLPRLRVVHGYNSGKRDRTGVHSSPSSRSVTTSACSACRPINAVLTMPCGAG